MQYTTTMGNVVPVIENDVVSAELEVAKFSYQLAKD